MTASVPSICSVLPKVDGKKLEDAYWSSREMLGYEITPADVIIGYMNDTTSFRTAFFLQKLCLRKVCFGNWSVSPEEVIAVFSSNGSQVEKRDLAIARFKSECCLQGLPLNGEPIAPDAVVAHFKQINVPLELTRFQNDCCRRGIMIYGQPVPAELVLEGYKAINAQLEAARFLQECCLTGLPLYGQHVAADDVISEFPDTNLGKLGAARFRDDCFKHGCLLNGEQISPEAVADSYREITANLEMARFLEMCCLHNVPLGGQSVTPRQVLWYYNAAKAQFDEALFRQECYLNGLNIAGKPLTPESVVHGFPNNQRGKLGITRFKALCCLRHLRFNRQLLSPELVAREFRAIGSSKEQLRFKVQCCLKAIPLFGQQLLPENLVAGLEMLADPIDLARFKAQCCLAGIWLHGHPIGPEEVINDFPPCQLGKLEATCFKAQCCLKGLAVREQPISPEAVIADFQALAARLEEADFRAQCCLASRRIAGQAVSPRAVLEAFPPSPAGKLAAACFTMECALQGLAEVSPSQAVKALAAVNAQTRLAHLKEQCCLTGLHLPERMICPEEVISHYQAAQNPLEAMRFQAQCCLDGIPLRGQQISPESIVTNIPKTQPGTQQLVWIKAQCCLQGLHLFGQPVNPGEVIRDFQIAGTLPEQARFLEACYLRGLIDVPPETVADNYQAINAFRELVQFKQQCCLLGLLLYGKPVMPEALLAQYERNDWLLEKAVFTARLALKGRKVNGKYLSHAQVLESFERVPGNCVAQQLEYLIQRLHAVPRLDYSDEAQTIFARAWQLINDCPLKNNESWVQKCRLRFLALQYSFRVDGQLLSADQVMQPVRALGNSFLKTRLRATILAYCHQTQQPLHEHEVTWVQVLECVDKLPPGAMRNALREWLTELCTPSSVSALYHSSDPQHSLATASKSNLSYRRPEVIPLVGNHGRVKRVSVLVSDLHAGGDLFPCLVEYPDDGVADHSSQLNPLTRNALKLMQGDDQLCITGECSRFLQGTGTEFNHIDVVGSEAAIDRLIATATAQLNRANPAVPMNVFAVAIPGIPQLHHPTTIHITLTQGELGSRSAVIQAQVHPVAKVANMARVLVSMPDADQPLHCLSLSTEEALMANTLTHLVENLDQLTTQLEDWQTLLYMPMVPTLLFKDFERREDRVCSLLVHCLLTLKKARELVCAQGRQQVELIRLIERLQSLLQVHSYRDSLVKVMSEWLWTARLNSNYEANRYRLVRSMLKTLGKKTVTVRARRPFAPSCNRMESYCNLPV